MRKKLFYTTEGRILLAGFILSFLLLFTIAYCWFVDSHTSRTLFLVFLAHTFGGRAAGIGLCIMNQFSPLVTIGYNFYLELLIICFTYSIFVLTATSYIRVGWLYNFMERLAGKALDNKTKIEAFGWWGIFLFVMVPLPVTGPVVGSIIGYMLRISLVRNFTATLAGTLAAIIFWYVSFDFLEQRFHAIQYILGAIVIMILLTKYKSIKKLLFGEKPGKP